MANNITEEIKTSIDSQQRQTVDVNRSEFIGTPDYPNTASLYSGPCKPIFDCDECWDDSFMSFCMAGSTSPLFDFIGYRRTSAWKKTRRFITYIGNEGTAAGDPISTLQGPKCCNDCGPGPGTEFGTCDWTCEGFDAFKVSGPVRKDDCETLTYCEDSPVYRVDGSIVADNDEWDMLQMTTAMWADAHRWAIKGTYGLENLVNYGYVDTQGNPCPAMDSCVIDLQCQPMCPEDGLGEFILNGETMPGGDFGWYDLFRSVVIGNSARIRKTPMLRNGAIDSVLLLPNEWIDCILKCYVCWTVCGPCITTLDSTEARTLLNNITTAGRYGAGQIQVGNTSIDLLPYDYELIDPATGCADMYWLVSQVGTTPLIEGEYQDMDAVNSKSGGRYEVTDGGMLAFHDRWDYGCYQKHGKMNMRQCMPGPWAQVRFSGVECALNGRKIQSCDPLSPYFIGGSPLVAQGGTCEPCEVTAPAP